MKINFNLTAGFLIRKSVRQELNNSKDKILHWYPGARVLLTESRNFWESEFYFEADNLPESAEAEMQNWKNKLEKLQTK